MECCNSCAHANGPVDALQDELSRLRRQLEAVSGQCSCLLKEKQVLQQEAADKEQVHGLVQVWAGALDCKCGSCAVSATMNSWCLAA